MAVSSRHSGRPPRPRRVAVEDRRVDAVRRLRPMATGVDRDPTSRPRHAVPRGPGVGVGGDGVGHAARQPHAIPAGGWAAGDPRAHRPFRAHRTAGRRGLDGSRVPGIEMTTMLRHNKVDLALHRLAGGDGTPLLLLHGLGEASPTEAPAWAAGWPGPVVAL